MQEKQGHPQLLARYRELFDRVSQLLFEADPMHINFVTNTDEYDPEAGSILPRLESAKSAKDVQIIVHQEFCHWFGAEDAGETVHYQVVAEKIWELYVNAKRS